MSLPWNVNASMGGAGVNYQIQRSLRIRGSASAYLGKTYASAGNRTTWTWSGWVKRGILGSVQQTIFGAFTSGTTVPNFEFRFSNDNIDTYDNSGSIQWRLITTQVFRDPSAWYHIVFAFDSTQATASNRAKLYVNGVQVTAFSTSTYPALNYSSYWNSTLVQGMGAVANQNDCYFAEINFIDGQALTPASFGYNDPVTGVWQPAPFKGTYGTNGFYLPFTDIATTSGSNFGLGRDYSGNANYWNTNNISVTSGSTYDSMIDSPTNFSDGSTYYNRGNYCTWNPLKKTSGITVTNGNLTLTDGANINEGIQGTIGASSGKWYAEVSGGPDSPGVVLVTDAANYPGSTANSYGYHSNATKYNNGSSSSYGATFTSSDVIGIALDMDSGTVTFYKNNVSQGIAFTGLVGTFTFCGRPYSATSDWNFGQRPFTYTPPTGFKALNTFNLPTPTIANGAAYMAATLYTGTGSNITIANSQSNGGNNALGKTFYPDFVWTKGRSAATNNILIDSVRGGANYLISDSTSAEVNNAAAAIQSFSSTGYVMGTGGAVNTNGATYVGWQWNAGSGSSSSNTSGTITSTVSANTTAGFSVATFTTPGGSNPQTIGHGLGVAPSMIIMKSRNNVSGWTVYHSAIGNTGALNLSATTATSTSIDWWQNTSPTSSVWSIGANLNISGWTWVAYCFAAVRGYSAFGSYTGNGSSDGPFVFTNFRPRWLMIKRTDVANDWELIDTSRSPYNVAQAQLAANDSRAELSNLNIDILSSGFKLREALAWGNASGGTYIYAAFAEVPYNFSRAR